MNTIKLGLALLAGFGTLAAEALDAQVAHAEPSVLWNQLGCTGCHGDNGVYRDEITGAIGKPVDAVARWIQDAPSIKPDTMMPSFKGAITEADARELAAWVQERATGLR